MASIAHIIFMNDSPRGVVLDNPTEAIKEKNRLRAEHMSTIYKDDVDYHNIYIWHINEAPVIGG